MNEENPNVTPPQSDNNAPDAAGVQSDTYSAPVEVEPTPSSFDVTSSEPVSPVVEPQPVVATPLESPVAQNVVTPVAEPVTTPELVTPVAEAPAGHKGLIVAAVAVASLLVVGVVAALMFLQ